MLLLQGDLAMASTGTTSDGDRTATAIQWPQGSIWRKWDLHCHTPASYDYDNKAVTDEQIIAALKSAGVIAAAITDHHVIDVPRILNLQKLAGEELTIFPGIELRTDLGGKESVPRGRILPLGTMRAIVEGSGTSDTWAH